MDSGNKKKICVDFSDNKEIPYTTRYERVKRHLDYFLRESLQNIYEPLSLEEIRERIGQTSGVKIGTKTILKQLPKLSVKLGESPLCKVRDKYRLNRCLYSYAKIKPPGIHNKYK